MARTLTTPEDALALVRKLRVLPLSPSPPLTSLVEEVCGGPIKGSWWGHPKGGLIYTLATALEESGEVLAAKVVDGKIAFVHRALFAPLLRYATDDGRLALAMKALGPEEKRLLALVRSQGELELDAAALRNLKLDRKRASKARTGLEKALLVVSTELHTDTGNHATVLRTFERWASTEVKKEASRLSLQDAEIALAALLSGSEEQAPEKAPRRKTKR